MKKSGLLRALQTEIQRHSPRCEHKGSLPHAATRIVVWELACGRQTKFMCEEHFKGIGSQPYWFGTLNGIWV